MPKIDWTTMDDQFGEIIDAADSWECRRREAQESPDPPGIELYLAELRLAEAVRKGREAASRLLQGYDKDYQDRFPKP